jgi:hypothetical protein
MACCRRPNGRSSNHFASSCYSLYDFQCSLPIKTISSGWFQSFFFYNARAIMTTTSLRLAAAVFLLVALTAAMEAEAIRLDAESRAAAVSQQTVVVVDVSGSFSDRFGAFETSVSVRAWHGHYVSLLMLTSRSVCGLSEIVER